MDRNFHTAQVEGSNNHTHTQPNKDHFDPTNYRSIALTSCVCKLLEKMINNRLQQYMENNKLLTNVQCGFRKSRSTADYLIILDTYIRREMAEDTCTLAVMFDLGRAYDKARDMVY